MSEITELCTQLLAAKAAEGRAKKVRIDLEDKIVKLVGNRPEGAQTVEEGNFKITTTGSITRKMDWDKWALVKDQISENLWPIKTKVELDETGVKYLLANEPEIYKLLPIEIKPAKTSVEIKVLELPVAEPKGAENA